MFVACSTLCFARHSLENALKLIAELEFTKFEAAIHEQGPHLRPSEVAADVAHAANRLRYGPGLTPAAFSVEIQTANDDEYFKQFKAICRLARLSTVPLLIIPAGSSRQRPRRRSAAARQAHGLRGSGSRSPDSRHAHRHADRRSRYGRVVVPESADLGLTLDPSHLSRRPASGQELRSGVYVRAPRPSARHRTWTESVSGAHRPGRNRVWPHHLATGRHGYERLLSVDVRDIADSPIAMEPEVRKLKYLLESLI